MAGLHLSTDAFGPADGADGRKNATRAIPEVFQLVEHVLVGVVDVDAHVSRLGQVLHGQLVREGAHEQSPDRVDRRDFIGQQRPLGLLAVLQEDQT